MNKEFFIDCLKKRPKLLEAILEENTSTTKIKEDLLAKINNFFDPDTFKQDEVTLLSSCLQSSLTLQDAEKIDLFWDYIEESTRLALLTEAELFNLAKICGVALHAKEIAKILPRKEVLLLKETLGHITYKYALHRGQYQLAERIVNLFANLHQKLPLAKRCELHGVLVLHLLTKRWSPKLVAKCEKKLPPKPSDPVSQNFLANFNDNNLSMLWFATKKLLLREVMPTWQQCFD